MAAPPQERLAAIVGGGVIGGGWAARFLLMGWDVAVFDRDPDAESKIGRAVDNARRSLPGLADVALPAEGTLRYCASIEAAVSGATWVQESVPEVLDIKRAVLGTIQQACPANAVVGSSTSGFTPAELGEGAIRPAQIIVAHPFNPVYLLPLVELVGAEPTVGQASEFLVALGMKPIKVRKPISAHIADRLMEATWREALWLVEDDVATTGEIDDAIRFGFGLRWAQMGLFETCRIAGGDEGMAHFLRQFGPALAWPWSRLTDVPELTAELVGKIAAQSNEQSGGRTVAELERIRDDNLVAMLRALKQRDHGAGALLNAHDRRMAPDRTGGEDGAVTTISRAIPTSWTDYNGHMNEGRYGQVFSNAADVVLELIGIDDDYLASGFSFFTVEATTRFRAEAHAGDRVAVTSRIQDGTGKKLALTHELRREDGELLAECDQLLIHVSLETRRSCEPAIDLQQRIDALSVPSAPKEEAHPS